MNFIIKVKYKCLTSINIAGLRGFVLFKNQILLLFKASAVISYFALLWKRYLETILLKITLCYCNK